MQPLNLKLNKVKNEYVEKQSNKPNSAENSKF